MLIAGAHGLWLLPSILSLVGGSKSSPEAETSSEKVRFGSESCCFACEASRIAAEEVA